MARSTSRDTRTEAGEDELQLSQLFRHLPVAVLKAKPTGTREAGAKGRSRREPS